MIICNYLHMSVIRTSQRLKIGASADGREGGLVHSNRPEPQLKAVKPAVLQRGQQAAQTSAPPGFSLLYTSSNPSDRFH